MFIDTHLTFQLWHKILLSCIRVTAKAVQTIDGALPDDGLPPELPVVDDLDHQRGHVQFLLGQELGSQKQASLLRTRPKAPAQTVCPFGVAPGTHSKEFRNVCVRRAVPYLRA